MRVNHSILACLLAALLNGCAERKVTETPRPDRSSASQSPLVSTPTKEVTAASEPTAPRRCDTWSTIDDPAADGWATEVFNENAGKRLKKLVAVLTDSKIKDTAVVSDAAIYREPFTEEPAEERRSASNFTVSRWVETKQSGSTATGSTEILQRLRDDFAPSGSESARMKFKIVSVKARDSNRIETDVRVEALVVAGGEATEHHATWTIQWDAKRGLSEEAPVIQSIIVRERELSRRPFRGGLLLADCTRSALEADSSYETQVLRGLPYWLERQYRHRATDIYGFPGIAVGDANGDGREDLYVCQSNGVPNALFLQNPDGTLSDRASQWGVNWLDDARGALLVDLDNDDDQDLVVAIIGFVIVAENTGSRFTIRTALPCTEDTTHLCAADYDLDGQLDLYVGAYFQTQDTLVTEQRLHANLYINADNGGPNHLFRNLGAEQSFAFQDVTKKVGLDAGNHQQTLGAAWEDFDGDGDPDLYVANDFGRNNFYRNDLGKDGTRHFTDLSADAGTEDTAFGMSAAWGDYDRDGRMDLYVANMWSSAGKRVISQQQSFKPGLSNNDRQSYLHFARGNTLLRNTGNGIAFQDVSETAGVTMGRWAWCSPFTDLNNDGWQDFVVANGYITSPDDTGDL